MVMARPQHRQGDVRFVVDEIRFEGNRRTRPEILLQEVVFRSGDEIERHDIENARQAIMDLGLFKSVVVFRHRVRDKNIVTIAVNEKRYWFVLPKLGRSGDGDITYGGQIEFDNFTGRNQSLEVVAQRKELQSSDVETEDSFEVEFKYPRMFGSAYELSIDAGIETAELNEDRFGVRGQYERDLSAVRIAVSRWLAPRGPSRGWRFGGWARWNDFRHEFISGTPGLFFDATVLTWAGFVEFIAVHDHGFSNSGREFGSWLEFADEDFGSDGGFVRPSLRYRHYWRITQRPHTNLNLQLRAALATDTIFGDPAYSIGGSTTLRGFRREDIEGDSFILANLEFLTPLYGHYAWRGAGFVDIGDAYSDFDEFNLSDLKVGAGFGLRWKLRSFVKTDLRLDFAYGFDGGETKVYAGTKATF